MSPIEWQKRREKVMQWQAPRSVVQVIRYILMLVCAIVAFTIANYGEDDANDLEQSGSIEPSVHLLSQG